MTSLKFHKTVNYMKIIECENNIKRSDILTLEETFNIIFPDNLKQLYLKYNGGIEESGEEIVDELYSIKYGENTLESIREMLQITENSIPLNYLIFATTGAGHQITYNLENGQIVLFRKDNLDSQLIASSLEDLFNVDSFNDFH